MTEWWVWLVRLGEVALSNETAPFYVVAKLTTGKPNQLFPFQVSLQPLNSNIGQLSVVEEGSVQESNTNHGVCFYFTGQVWWYIPMILALSRPKQGKYEFEVNPCSKTLLKCKLQFFCKEQHFCFDACLKLFSITQKGRSTGFLASLDWEAYEW